MRSHNLTPSKRRRHGQSDPLDRQARRDLAATLARDYARETRAERRAVELDRFADRRYA